MIKTDAQLLPRSDPQRCGPGVIISNVTAPSDPNTVCPFELIEFSVEPHCASEPHAHDSAEIWYITRGWGRVLTGDGEISVKRGDVVYLRPNTVHQIENDADEVLTALSMCWTGAA